MASWGRAGSRIGVAALVIAALAPPAGARERQVRVYGFDDGLRTTGPSCIVRDAAGFLWVCGVQDVFRFDGRRFDAMNRRPLTHRAWSLVPDVPDGPLFLLQRDGGTPVRLVDGDVVPWTPAVEPPLDGVFTMHATRDGAVWVADRHGVRRRGPDGGWRTWPTSRFDGSVRLLFDDHEPDSVLAAAFGDHVWRVRPDGEAVAVYDADAHTPGAHVIRAAVHPDGRMFVTQALIGSHVALVEVRDGVAREVHRSTTLSPFGIAVDGDAVWMVGNALVRWHPTGGVDRIDTGENGFRGSGGELLLDEEGSLWVASVDLLQLPAPGTFALTEADGLPDARPAQVLPTARGPVVVHARGLARLEGAAVAEAIDDRLQAPACADGDGNVWYRHVEVAPVPEYAVAVWDGAAVRRFPLPGRGWGLGWSCATAPDGGVWLSHGDAIYRTRGPGREPHRVTALPGAGGGIRDLLAARDGTLWAVRVEEVCHAPADALHDDDPWSCERVDATAAHGLVETDDGAVWMATADGVLADGPQGWAPLPGIEPREVSRLSVSPRGGVWAPGFTGARRIAPDPDRPGVVRVVEEIGAGSGLVSRVVNHVHETGDGVLWVSAAPGLHRLDASTRDARRRAPRIALVSATADGAALPPAGGPPLSHGAEVEVRFAALSFLEPSAITYRVRTRADEPWSETTLPELRFADLSAGDYVVEAVASLDGRTWSPTPARVEFRVLPPWYLRAPALAGYAIATAMLAYAAYRLRVAVLLRIERQRTRIAMNLHDEMGSGLGSIGILSSFLRHERLGRDRRDELVGQIESTAEELHASLSDIVWTLRPRARDLDAVVRRLEQRANRLFPEGRVETEVDPRAGGRSTSLIVRTNLLSIGTEALHNAARHGRAARVSISLRRDGGRWSLQIADDGVGPPADVLRDLGDEEREGLGIASMRRRADELGGVLALAPGEGGGCVVTVTFDSSRSGA